MPLLLTEADVRAILTMPMALEDVETSFRRLGDGAGVSHPRRRLLIPGKTILNYMAAADVAGGYLGLKIYSISRGRARFIIPLFRAETGEMAALIEADYLGQMRTGAASGLAANVMAREDARTVGIIGTGLQARTQLEAVVVTRKVERIRAFGRDAQRRETFAKEMTQRLGVPVTPASSAEEAVRGMDIVITATTSKTPVLEGRWIERGMHISAIGVNFAEKREIDSETVRRCDVIAADSVEQSKIESGDLIQAFAGGESRWATVREFADIVVGKVPGRTSRDQVTLFKSNGIAIEDIVVAGRIYELAKQRGMGCDIPMWQEEEA
ncbi:MAG TPA: ornithine cyclodeaminase family protein [Candidatus Acidoferrales bacterium]|jgi:ornithine cyclodeaminase/alanine dehydrogenase-like protein (mu-crystallin family)|nr:ornithine cyclodeaminase family protein [Candidatus Acidoferrales bacterium]